jgi:hypothetical protein
MAPGPDSLPREVCVTILFNIPDSEVITSAAVETLLLCILF